MKKNLWMLAAILLCGVMTAQAAEVSDSLQQDSRGSEAIYYRFNYPSVNADGQEVVLSSLLVAWNPEEPKTTDSIESVHIYSHFTITADYECPTSDQNLKERVLFALFAKESYGLGLSDDQNFISHCIIIAPDYEGYGVTKDLAHPYMAQELTARQMTDAVDYGLRLYQKHVADHRALPFKSDWRSFGFGFSQGGAVALAVQRRMEQLGTDRELRYRGSIVGDGPYDLVATMRYYMEDDGNSFDTETDHRKGMNTMPMVVPMIIQGMLDTHPDMKGHKLEDYLSQQFLDTGIMEWLESKEYVVNEMAWRPTAAPTPKSRWPNCSSRPRRTACGLASTNSLPNRFTTIWPMHLTSTPFPPRRGMPARTCTVRWPTTASPPGGSRSTASSSYIQEATWWCPSATTSPSAMPTPTVRATGTGLTTASPLLTTSA